MGLLGQWLYQSNNCVRLIGQRFRMGEEELDGTDVTDVRTGIAVCGTAPTPTPV